MGRESFAATVIYFSALTAPPFLRATTSSALGPNKYLNFLYKRSGAVVTLPVSQTRHRPLDGA